MKAIFIAVAAFAASVVAQTVDISKLPSCAMPCVQPVLSGTTTCKAGDIKCICEDKTTINTVGQCLTKDCSQTDQNSAIAFASALCLSASVTIPSTIAAETTGTTITTTRTETGTITSAPTTATTTTAYSNSTANHTATTQTSTSTGAAATGYMANGLGVAGAAVAAFFFL